MSQLKKFAWAAAGALMVLGTTIGISEVPLERDFRVGIGPMAEPNGSQIRAGIGPMAEPNGSR